MIQTTARGGLYFIETFLKGFTHRRWPTHPHFAHIFGVVFGQFPLDELAIPPLGIHALPAQPYYDFEVGNGLRLTEIGQRLAKLDSDRISSGSERNVE
jgi:hypothetical protein